MLLFGISHIICNKQKLQTTNFYINLSLLQIFAYLVLRIMYISSVNWFNLGGYCLCYFSLEVCFLLAQGNCLSDW